MPKKNRPNGTAKLQKLIYKENKVRFDNTAHQYVLYTDGKEIKLGSSYKEASAYIKSLGLEVNNF